MIKSTISLLLSFLLFSNLFVNAQLAPDTYWIQFTDRSNTPYSFDTPSEYLSDLSIDRRTQYSIDIDSLDLPVNPWYLDSITNKGATVLHTSKWMNGAAIYTDNATVLQSIYDLDFVDAWVSTSEMFTMNFSPINTTPNITAFKATNNSLFDYGLANNQIDLHSGQALHNYGFQGQGMRIAVIDAGFEAMDQVAAFDSIFTNNQIIGTWDFVNNDTNVYDDHWHGKAVLSTIAAYLPGEMVGTAPKAEFLLLRSEVANTEYKIEEIYWIAAAEYADSIGVDIITTSLGYNDYDLPSTSYTWDDLDGQTAPITLATDIAAEKGLFMVTSAGNEGTVPWAKITSPADANHALTVGACTSSGDYASFSSKGNTADDRIKPDVSGQGQLTTIITGNTPTTGNGTSFSTPIIAGLTACLWQVDRSKNNFEIREMIKKHSHQFSNPDSLMGYGIPNFANAYDELTQNINIRNSEKEQLIKVYPYAFNDELRVKFFAKKQREITVEIISIKGHTIYKQNVNVDSNQINVIQITGLSSISSGMYFIRVTSGSYVSTKKGIKL